MYNGTAPLATPTAAPTSPLPATITHTSPATACTSAPAMKSSAGKKITERRPYLSAKKPVEGAERSASRLVMAVMRDLSAVVRAR